MNTRVTYNPVFQLILIALISQTSFELKGLIPNVHKLPIHRELFERKVDDPHQTQAATLANEVSSGSYKIVMLL